MADWENSDFDCGGGSDRAYVPGGGLLEERVAWLLALKAAGKTPAEIAATMASSIKPPAFERRVPTHGPAESPKPIHCAAGPRIVGRWTPVPPREQRAVSKPVGAAAPRPQKPRPRLGLGTAMEAAAIRGGRCLAGEYRRNDVPLAWECSAGHRWKSPLKNVLSGSWCRACEGGARRGSVADLDARAEAMGGRCLSRTYVKRHTRYEWECSEGHRWSASAANVLSGTWCPSCRKSEAARRRGPGAWPAERLKAAAAERGGSFLGPDDGAGYVPRGWRCSEGHEWFAPASSIIGPGGHWCPECSQKRKSEAMTARFGNAPVETACPFCGGRCKRNGRGRIKCVVCAKTMKEGSDGTPARKGRPKGSKPRTAGDMPAAGRPKPLGPT